MFNIPFDFFTLCRLLGHFGQKLILQPDFCTEENEEERRNHFWCLTNQIIFSP